MPRKSRSRNAKRRPHSSPKANSMHAEGGDPTAVREAIFEIIANQMNADDPPETKQTFQRLLAEGYPEEEVMKYIGSVVISEIFGILKEHEPFDRDRFVKALHALPTLPWD